MCNSRDIKKEDKSFLSLCSFFLPEILAGAPEIISNQKVTFGYWTVTFPSLDNERATRYKEPGSPTPWIARANLDGALDIL